jgi:class 3 adenylate cyclase
MALRDELERHVRGIVTAQWQQRQGLKVPDTEDIAFKNEAVQLDATVLYGDLAASTKMVTDYKDWYAAEIYKSYLYCAAKIIRSNGGVITAYDGDRVMAVFIGDNKNNAAARSGLQVNWACEQILTPQFNAQYPTTNFPLKQRVGIDTSSLFIARTGIRGSNDLVWVGNAANNAAKMAALDPRYPTYISADVYSRLTTSRTGGEHNQDMWTNLGTSALGYRIYGSSWWWEVS